MRPIEKVVNEENAKKVKNFAKRSCQAVIPILGTVLASISVKDLMDMFSYSGDVDYGDAVNAIMSSTMYSHDKTRAVSVLKVGETSDFYKAVINVAKSSAYSHDKVTTIANMSGTE